MLRNKAQLLLQREVGHVIHAGRAGRKGSAMLFRSLVALRKKVCRMPVFRSRKPSSEPAETFA